MEKVSLPKGTRDFGPAQMAKRQFIIESIKKVFRQYGFQPLETPAMENLSTLQGKYGEEGDQLLFKILNSGDFLKDTDPQHIQNGNWKLVTSTISEKGLRYDLTVPFARYVVMNRHEIIFPFKRYQIQPVWRADRPQKGRYREFYQCDADVVGTDSLVCEAEIILMIRDAFKALNIADYSIKINHRAILSGLAEVIGAAQNEGALFVAIDKLDKIGEEKVRGELRSKNFSEQNLNLLFDILNFTGSTSQKTSFLSQHFSSSERGQKGLSDFREVMDLLGNFGASPDHVEFDIALARGLSYYTGCIFEVKINNVGIGSVSGGGRYDNLTAVFDSKEKSSGVGFSFGIDRIYDAMEELRIFPKEATAVSTVLTVHLDKESFQYGLRLTQTLREKGIAAEIYPDQTKIKKQLEYADRKKIPFVVVIGSEEVKTGILTLKKMETGEQVQLSLPEIVEAVQIHP
ncbi:MAG TPA: histidine--tRNA ligase [Cyclobacteriaceae bacterium]|nr:histidine--tRNA ligase [Cyclobacteriaceae bacterium]